MLGHGAKFSQKMEQAIVALLSQRNVEEAARAVGICANTLLRWLKEPEFEAALREARRVALSQAIGRLQDSAGAAVTTVLRIMLDPNALAGTRLRAAEIVLEQGRGAMEDIEDRVAKLERAAGSIRKARKRSAVLTLVNATPLPGPATTREQIAAPTPDIPETAPLADTTQTDEDE
jgi:transposase-like protein